MPVVDQNHQMTLQASLQHCCQVNVSLTPLGLYITGSSDQPTHVAER